METNKIIKDVQRLRTPRAPEQKGAELSTPIPTHGFLAKEKREDGGGETMERKQGPLIHCANKGCQKPIIKDVSLVEGTRFMVKCYWCGAFNRIIVHFKFIEKKLVAIQEQRHG